MRYDTIFQILRQQLQAYSDRIIEFVSSTELPNGRTTYRTTDPTSTQQIYTEFNNWITDNYDILNQNTSLLNDVIDLQTIAIIALNTSQAYQNAYGIKPLDFFASLGDIIDSTYGTLEALPLVQLDNQFVIITDIRKQDKVVLRKL